MELQDILKKVRKIEISSGKLADEVFSGEYKSIFKGRGMEFSEVREYFPGDDIRNIDWNVSARAGSLFVKKYVEERELTVFLMIDVSASSAFGTQSSKMDLAAELAGIISFSAMRNNDKVGLMLFSDRIEKFVHPKKGKNHILRIITDILKHTPVSAGTDISGALEYLNRTLRKRAVLFLLSDFLSSGYENVFRITARKNDLVCIRISDPLEAELPKFGTFRFRDMETGATFAVSRRSFSGAAEIIKKREEYLSYLNGLAKKSKVDMIELETGRPYILPLIRFFKTREKKIRGGS